MRSGYILLVILVILLSKTVSAQKYEAEDAVLTNGATIVSNSANSGGAYVAQGEGALSFDVTLPNSGFYNIYINAASPHGEKINILAIGDNTLNFGLDHDSQYKKIRLIAGQKLSSGSHSLKIRKSWGWINIDYIEFEEADANQAINLNQALINPAAAPEATALFDFLLDNYGSKIISGVMTLKSMDESDWLKANTGKEPALLGIDLMHSGRDYDWYDDLTPINDAITWYDRNGIPAVMWHWRDPSRTTEAFYTAGTSFDVSKISDENSAEYAAILQDIDYVAGLFKILQDANVPIIWRPLHEAAGGWFWWGAKGPVACKSLYQLMYNRMVNYHGLNNLVWVWTREPNDDAWYPGDEYVDIAGRDIYKTGDHSSQGLEFIHMNEIYGGKKMLTLSECGSFPDVDNLVNEQVSWSWFMPWYGDFTRNATYNSLELWKKTLKHEYVITLDEMPALHSYERQNPDPGVVTGLEDQLIPLKVYPTLVKEQLTVESMYLIESLVVYNSSGSVIINQDPQVYSTQIAFNNVAPGMYFVRVNNKNAVRVIKK